MAFVESDTEPESESCETQVTDPDSDPDNEYSAVIENQLGLPEYQYGFVDSSPPPVDANFVHDDSESKNNGEFLSKRGHKLSFE
jgi:hypothetical protein